MQRSRKRFRATRGLRTRRSPQPKRGIPNKMVVTLPYFDQGSFTRIATAGLANTQFQVFNLNSLFKPNSTSAGHQPLYFDQYAGTWYEHYQVLGVKWTATAYLDSETNTGTDTYLTSTIHDDDVAVSPVLTSEVLESPRFQKRSMRDAQGSSRQVTLHGYVRPRRYAVNKNAEDYSAAVGASPADLVHLSLGYANAYGGATVSTSVSIRWKIRFEMTALFTRSEYQTTS